MDRATTLTDRFDLRFLSAARILRDLRKREVGEGTGGLLHGHAAIQREDGAGCEPAFIAREKQYAGGDFLGGA
jgi:hypothetical protein